ncbi:MAG: PASTA domain-containing protein, partial [Gaiellaceae bacterium]
MALRIAARLPRLLVLGCVFLFAGATLTYGAASRIAATAGPKTTAPVSAPTVVVPDVSGQAFVFAKGALEDSGFAWHVVGSVHGYAVNRVVTQDPAPGTKLKDTGAPTVTVSLVRTSYAETGEPEDVSPYYGTAVVYANALPAVAPVAPVPVAPLGAEQKTPVVKKTVVKKTAVKKPSAAPVKPSSTSTSSPSTKRPPAFVVAAAPKEPLKEMPLTDRARVL